MRFLRAPALTDLDPDEVSRLVAIDPAAIIDFRGESETGEQVAGLPAALAARRVSLPIEPRATERFRELVADGATPATTLIDVMIETYRDFVRINANAYARFLRLASAVDGQPLLFHCTAGKDRTGLAAALILTALGAQRRDVMRDYLATADLWQPDDRLRARIPAAAHAAVFGVAETYLDAAFDELDRRAGGAAAFIRDALGGEAAHHAFVERHLHAP